LETQVFILNLLRTEYDRRVAFSKLLEEEKQAAVDHKLAISLHGLKVDDPDVKSCAEYEASLCNEEDSDLDDEWDRARELYAAGSCGGAAGPTPPNEGDSEDVSDAGGAKIVPNVVRPVARATELARVPDPTLQNLNQAVARLCAHSWTRNDIRGVC
jgi:hypothetical protein